MKLTDYHSSSDEDDEPAPKRTITASKSVPQQDNSRLSDDSEHNFDDDDDEDVDETAATDEAEASDEEPEDDVEFDDEVSDEDEETAIPEVAAKTQIQGSEDDDDEADDADGDDENTDADTEDDEDDATEGNADWAKSLAKILKQEKPKNKKIVALSKAKKTSDILEAREKAKAVGFAIDGEVKEEKPDVDLLEAADIAEAQKRKKREAFNLRIKPTLMDRERERAFKKIATKGVVQLFNAVRVQQRDLSAQLEQAGRLDHRRDAVLNNINKRKFLDVLMGGKRSKSENVDNPIKDELKEEDDDGSDMDDMDDAVYNDGLPKNSIWSVLKEDFLSNKKMSHWDKDEEEDGAPDTDGEAADSN